jgi:hypothetical protein
MINPLNSGTPPSIPGTLLTVALSQQALLQIKIKSPPNIPNTSNNQNIANFPNWSGLKSPPKSPPNLTDTMNNSLNIKTQPNIPKTLLTITLSQQTLLQIQIKSPPNIQNTSNNQNIANSLNWSGLKSTPKSPPNITDTLNNPLNNKTPPNIQKTLLTITLSQQTLLQIQIKSPPNIPNI